MKRQKLKGPVVKSCVGYQLQGSPYCRECYDFGLFVGAQSTLEAFA